MNGKLTRKDKCTVNVGNHLHTYMISKQVIVRRGEHKYRILEMHLKLRNQQLKTTLYIYRLLNQNVMGNANQKLQPRLLYPARISFRFEGEIKTFTDKQKL